MKIKKITLNNFGIHRNLSFEIGDAPVVGLLGKNGSGKSTILDSVKYALTGEIEGKIEDSVTIGEKKGFVELLIEKDGASIRIKREVGKTPKKEFEKDGKVVTSSKEIESEIQGMLSVDKKALSNACFLKQGSLNDLLFGTESSREQLFIKLVNLSFCERYAAVVDTKLKSLQAGVEDLQGLTDEINIQRMDSIVEKELLEKQLARVTDYKPITSVVYEQIRLSDENERLSREITLIGSDDKLTKTTIGTINLRWNTVDRIQLEDKLKESRNSSTELLQKKSNVISEKNAKIRYENTLQKITETKNEIEDLEKLITSNDTSLEQLVIPDTNIEVYKKELDDAKDSIKKLGMLLSIYHTCDSESATCPTCGSDISSKLNSGDVETWNKELKIAVADKGSVEVKIAKDTERFSNYELTKHNLMSENQINKIRLEHMTKDFHRYTESMVSLMDGANIGSKEKELETINQAINEQDATVKLLEQDLYRVIEAETKLANNSSFVVSKKAMLDSNHTKSVTNSKNIPEFLESLNLSDFIGLDNEKLIKELECLQLQRSEAEGRLKQASESFDKINNRYAEVQDRMTKNKSRLAVAEELREIKEILSKKGLPSAYIAHKFTILAKLTSENLTILNADFTVDIDPDAFLSFVFERFDGKDMVRLPMNRLSGGQKVRLCIAFLLSVQQELVPDIGFQTFDEPSTHLDEDGVERLCSMFKSLQDLLRCIDHQVWVCDHNPLLEESFSTTLNLQ